MRFVFFTILFLSIILAQSCSDDRNDDFGDNLTALEKFQQKELDEVSNFKLDTTDIKLLLDEFEKFSSAHYALIDSANNPTPSDEIIFELKKSTIIGLKYAKVMTSVVKRLDEEQLERYSAIKPKVLINQ